jgi:hypothetical protein
VGVMWVRSMRLCRVRLKWWQGCSLKSAVLMIGSQEAALTLAREVQIGAICAWRRS